MFAKTSNKHLKFLPVNILFMVLLVSCTTEAVSPSRQGREALLTQFGISNVCEETLCWQKIRVNERLPQEIQAALTANANEKNTILIETEEENLYRWDDPENNITIDIQTDKQYVVQSIKFIPHNASDSESNPSMAEIFKTLGQPSNYAATSFFSIWGGGRINYTFIFEQLGVAINATETRNLETSTIVEPAYVGYAQSQQEFSSTFVAEEVIAMSVYFFVPELVDNLLDSTNPIGLDINLYGNEFKNWPTDNKIVVQATVSR